MISKRKIKKKQNEVMEKRQKIAELLKHHSETFTKLKVANPLFFPKMAYNSNGVTVVSFFPSEIERGEDIYTEFVSRNYDSEDENRTLYKWKHNPHYASDYEIAEPHQAHQSIRYLIPTTELINVNKQLVDEVLQSDNDFDLPDPDSDLPIDQLTIRDFAAIMTGKPVSRKEWLNKIIKK